jgi:competence protein ComEC
MWYWLEGVASVDPGWTLFNPPWWAVAGGVFGAMMLLLPKGVPGRWLGLLCFSPLLFASPAGPAKGELWFTLLDVGQGLSVVVRTQEHTLIYDTGPSFSEQFDTGSAVIVPYLRQVGVRAIDRLIISHSDNDHLGGARSLLKHYEAGEVLVAGSERIQIPGAKLCVRGQQWRWDGIEFSIIYPDQDKKRLNRISNNNDSCILRIVAPGGTILLTGDIEKQAEKDLLNDPAVELTADILVVPHHGSKTSSTHGFIRAVDPEFALFPVGYRNRYRLPSQEIVKRYGQYQARMLDTASHGAITLRLEPEAGITEIDAYRYTGRHYWNR